MCKYFSSLIVCLLFVNTLIAQQPQFIVDAYKIVEKSQNKSALQQVLNHYDQPSDSLKLRAACFLIANMHIHKSFSYYWADSTERKLDYDELAYANWDASLNAFEGIKGRYGKVHPVKTQFTDLESIKADYLIANIDEAFRQWDQRKYDFNTFCEYLLPYRVSVEPLYDWRKTYRARFDSVVNAKNTPLLRNKIQRLADNVNLWFTCTYNLEKRADPLPRLGSLQLLHRQKGLCEDAAALAVFSLRSLGIPATVDVVPYWATASGGHSLNCAFDSLNRPFHFDVLSESDSLHEFIREPAKVFRSTYSVQPNTLAAQIPAERIPRGYLRSPNYIDVTHEYWKTRDIRCALSNKDTTQQIVYISAFNSTNWKEVWWAKANGDSCIFTNMSQGAVYLPSYFKNGKSVAAGYPVASSHQGVIELKPDLVNTHTVRITELSGYLKFRPGRAYRLGYFLNKWIPISEQVADEKTTEMVFDNVPRNALLILIPDSGRTKERPFIITDEGERFWW